MRAVGYKAPLRCGAITTKSGPGWKSIEFNSTQIHHLKPLALVLDHLTEDHKLDSSLSQVYQVDSDDRFVMDLS